MPRDKKVEYELKHRSAEETVVEYIDGVFTPPAHIKPLVEAYNRRRAVVDTCESYPKSIDKEMDSLFDAMIVKV